MKRSNENFATFEVQVVKLNQYVTELRADFAQIQNAVLEQNGFSIRVDHRSLKVQKEEEEQNGDTSLVRLFNRVPEKYIGIISCQENDEPRLEQLKIFRAGTA